MRQTVLLVGVTGHGKSTTGNILINMSGRNSDLENPFLTSNGASGCTQVFEKKVGERFEVLDIAGYGDPVLSITNVNHVYTQIRDALLSVQNRVNVILFVVEGGRFTDAVVKFFEFIRENVFDTDLVTNSVLLLTKCEEGFVSENLRNEHLRKALDVCGGRFFELDLDLDKKTHNEEMKRNNELSRTRRIESFLTYLDGLNLPGKELKMLTRLEIVQAAVEEESCFPGTTLVETIKRGLVPISELTRDDLVKSFDLVSNKWKFSRFVFYLHEDEHTSAEYISIKTSSNINLKISPMHLIPKRVNQNELEFVFAQDLKLDEILFSADNQNERIIGLTRVVEQGVYAPLLESGTISVNNLLASCYANIKWQGVAHVAFQPAIQLLNLFNMENNQDKNKMSPNGINWYAGLLSSLFPFMKIS